MLTLCLGLLGRPQLAGRQLEPGRERGSKRWVLLRIAGSGPCGLKALARNKDIWRGCQIVIILRGKERLAGFVSCGAQKMFAFLKQSQRTVSLVRTLSGRWSEIYIYQIETESPCVAQTGLILSFCLLQPLRAGITNNVLPYLALKYT